MSADPELRKRVELGLLAADLVWARRAVGDMVARQAVGGPVSLCSASHLSLLLVESFQYLKVGHPSFADELALIDHDLIRRSRHRIKLFDDTQNDLEQTIAYFAGPLATAHRRRFLDNARFEWAKRFEKDLGLSTYDGRLISTTHAMHYQLGADVDMFDRDTSALMQGFGNDLGKYFTVLTREMDWAGPLFVASIDGSKLRTRDVKSWEYYPVSFGGNLEEGAAAALSRFRAVMNTVDVLFGLDPESTTTFKLTYVSLYHVLRSLRALYASRGHQLSALACSTIDEILTNPFARRLVDASTTPLRNTLIHYRLDTRIPSAALDESVPLGGLAELFFPGEDATSLNHAVRTEAGVLAGALDTWARAGG